MLTYRDNPSKILQYEVFQGGKFILHKVVKKSRVFTFAPGSEKISAFDFVQVCYLKILEGQVEKKKLKKRSQFSTNYLLRYYHVGETKNSTIPLVHLLDFCTGMYIRTNIVYFRTTVYLFPYGEYFSNKHDVFICLMCEYKPRRKCGRAATS